MSYKWRLRKFAPFRGASRSARLAVVGAVATLCAISGLAAASSSAAASPASSAAASPAAASGPRLCPWGDQPATFVVGDPTANYASFGGFYSGARGVAYKVTGQFPHSTTISFTAYDDLGFVGSTMQVLNDVNIVPQPGSRNPWVPGTLVNVTPRNYVVWFWPEGVPIPKGLKNVLPFPTVPNPAASGDRLIRMQILMRQYLQQPGYSARRSLPTIQAFSVGNLNAPIRCPASVSSGPRALGVFFVNLGAALRTYGGPTPVPVPVHSNRIAFVRAPYQFVSAPESFAADGCINYVSAQVDPSKISVVTWHRTATFFNNQHLSPGARMGNYQVRYMSVGLATVPITKQVSVNSSNAVFQRNGAWITVLLPSNPYLPPSQERAVRARAAALGYNVISVPRAAPRLLPVLLNVRQQRPADSFPDSLRQVPCWTNPHNPATEHNPIQDWHTQTSPKFFAEFASSRCNMGPYYIDGVEQTFAEFMRHPGAFPPPAPCVPPNSGG